VVSLVELSVAGPVATITLADERRRNALSAQLLGELVVALDAAEADGRVRALVLTHRGPAFCAGADLSGGPAPAPGADLPAVIARLVRSRLPVVARIAGPCVAGGMGIAAACDLALASDGVTFAFTEVRIGVVPAIIAVVCLPRLREGDARELFLTGRRIDAAEAQRRGLITRAVSADALDDALAGVLAEILAGAPGALAAAKQLLAQHRYAHLEEDLARAAATSAELFAGEEAREGIAAFLERRRPAWVSEPASGARGGAQP
jgi:methylglutaconyl-CoA hydratase